MHTYAAPPDCAFARRGSVARGIIFFGFLPRCPHNRSYLFPDDLGAFCSCLIENDTNKDERHATSRVTDNAAPSPSPSPGLTTCRHRGLAAALRLLSLPALD